MNKYLKDIKEKTSGMSKKEASSYILTYYWYHILGIVSIVALIFLFICHYGFGNKKPIFACMIVNQEINTLRDQKMADLFAEKAGLPKERVVIDSDYNFSYGQVRLEGANESSYEKFFFQWQNHEIDAVILPESFYRHCKEMGGEFRTIGEETAKGFDVYIDEGECRAVILGNDSFMERITGRKDEKLLLSFPVSGENEQEGRRFMDFLHDELKVREEEKD